MTYQLDLDEMTESALEKELADRKEFRDKGLCDYCHQLGDTPTCKMKQRHFIAQASIDEAVKASPEPTVVRKLDENEFMIDALGIVDKLDDFFTEQNKSNLSLIGGLREGLLVRSEGTKALVLSHLLAAFDLVAMVEEVAPKKNIEKTVPVRADRNLNTDAITPLECPLKDVDNPECRKVNSVKCVYFRGLAMEKSTDHLYSLCAKAYLKPIEGEGEFD